MRTALTLLVVSTVALAARAAEPLGCLIEPDMTSAVGSPIVGVVSEILVERGDRVEAGQVIARHKCQRARADNACAVYRTTAQQHLAEAVVVADRGNKSAATGIESVATSPTTGHNQILDAKADRSVCNSKCAATSEGVDGVAAACGDGAASGAK